MTEGTIFLLGPLDFEKQSMYHLSLLAIVSLFILLIFNHMLRKIETFLMLIYWLSRLIQFNCAICITIFFPSHRVCCKISQHTKNMVICAVDSKLIRWKWKIYSISRCFTFFSSLSLSSSLAFNLCRRTYAADLKYSLCNRNFWFLLLHAFFYKA